MPTIQLVGGAYTSRSLISAAQRCLNLYPENIPFGDFFNRYKGEPNPFINLPTPGLTLLAQAPDDIIRCTYTASNGDLYVVAGTNVYYVNSTWSFTKIGTMQPSSPTDAVSFHTPCYMADNGQIAILVDGTLDGWTFTITKHGSDFARIDPTVNTGWYGSDRVDYMDTFFLCNKPDTPIYYISGSETADFDPLDFASKVSQGDNLQAVIVLHRIFWLLGTYTTEMWQNTGGDGTAAGSFPFSIIPGAFGDRGLAAKYSLARQNNNIFWLSQDKAGQGVVMHGLGYDMDRISTHAIEATISSYSRIDDAIGFCYQQQGHDFYVLSFPTADATWVYDLTTQHWHERCWLDDNGIEHRHRANCITNAYSTVVCGDWENGNLYKLDLNNFTDNGQPIKRLRHFPHILDQDANRRISYKQFIANMQVGTSQALSPAQTVVDCTWDAPDGTLLEDYTQTTGDIGASWSKVSGTNEAEVVNGEVAGMGSGEAAYSATNSPTSPDYTVQFVATPSAYTIQPTDGANVFAIGRASGDATQGYQLAVQSDGTQYNLVLSVLNTSTSTTVALGTLSSGYWTVTLGCQSTAITGAIQRSADSLWLQPDGTWVGSPSTAISLSDSTYTAAGEVIIGGNW